MSEHDDEIRRAYREWVQSYYCPDGATVSYYDCFRAGIAYARRTPGPATKQLLDVLTKDWDTLTTSALALRIATIREQLISEWPDAGGKEKSP